MSRQDASELFEGGYYSFLDGEVFSIAKVLKIDPDIVHIRVFKQHFPQRPLSIDLAKLTLGTIHDKDGFGAGHLPLKTSTFNAKQPRFIAFLAVTESELEGYAFWLDVGGEAWE